MTNNKNKQKSMRTLMNKKAVVSLLALSTSFMLGACHTAQQPVKESASTNMQNSQDQTQGENRLITENDLANEKQPNYDNFDGIELDETSGITMESLIEQLRKDQIVSGTPKDINSGIEGALRATQIGSAIIIQYDTSNSSAFSKVYQTKTVHYQDKDYKVAAINGQFVLILMDDTNIEKAADSFKNTPNTDDRLIHF